MIKTPAVTSPDYPRARAAWLTIAVLFFATLVSTMDRGAINLVVNSVRRLGLAIVGAALAGSCVAWPLVGAVMRRRGLNGKLLFAPVIPLLALLSAMAIFAPNSWAAMILERFVSTRVQSSFVMRGLDPRIHAAAPA